MKRAKYIEGVVWIAFNDDPSILDAELISEMISTLLLADLFGVTALQVAKDVLNYRTKKQERKLAKQYGIVNES